MKYQTVDDLACGFRFTPRALQMMDQWLTKHNVPFHEPEEAEVPNRLETSWVSHLRSLLDRGYIIKIETESD